MTKIKMQLFKKKNQEDEEPMKKIMAGQWGGRKSLGAFSKDLNL